MSGGWRVAALVAACGLLAAATTPAATPRSRPVSAADLGRGRADGVAVSREGRLFLAPRVTRLDGESASVDAIHVLAMTSDAAGRVYLGTSPAGQVLKLEATGRSRVFFTAEEPVITALVSTPGGELLVASAPGGTIYRVGPDGRGTVWCETGERYVWSLAVGADGAVFAGTGEGGRVLRIHRDGGAEPFFDAGEPHVVSLLALPDGGLLAGGAGHGLVYAIDKEGNGHVLHDGDLEEAAALEVDGEGNILAAFVAAPPQVTPPPALRLRLPDGTQVGAVEENVVLEDPTGPTLRGVIEGLPSLPGPAVGTRGRLVRISPSGASTELWSSRTDAPFCLVRDAVGRALFGTGPPARLYRLEPDGDVALVATLGEAHLSALIRIGHSLFAATSNPSAVYRIDDEPAEAGVFLSAPLDAGAPARWGSIRWAAEGSETGAEIYTRTGNSALPDDTWSAWGPVRRVPNGSAIDNPDGRYLQWRARFAGAGAGKARLSAVEVLFEPHNRPPRGRELGIDGRAVSTEADVRWSVSDPDRDPVEVLLEYRGMDAADWTPATTTSTLSVTDEAADGTPGWYDGTLAWDTSDLPQGVYELRGVLSDEAANAPGEGFRVPLPTRLRLTVDRTPPELEVRATGGAQVEVVVTDAWSRIERLELRREGRSRFSLRPVDGLCDSPREIFRFDLPEAGDGWSVRVRDAAGNEIERTLPAS